MKKKGQPFSNSHYAERLETLSANFVGHFVEKSNRSQNSSTKCPDKVGDENTQTAIMRIAGSHWMSRDSSGYGRLR